MPTSRSERINSALEYFVWTIVMPMVLVISISTMVLVAFSEERFRSNSGFMWVLIMAAYLIAITIFSAWFSSEQAETPDLDANSLFPMRYIVALASSLSAFVLWSLAIPGLS